MKTIQVVAAVICDRDRIFASQRGYGENKGKWEFPGGKIEPGETPQQALVREIWEELGADIAVYERLDVIEQDDPRFHITLQFFRCELIRNRMEIREHEAVRWLTKEEWGDVEWLPADREMICRMAAAGWQRQKV